ncbi:hypothetical protein QQ045_027752 [Rhodiola kirilowii]
MSTKANNRPIVSKVFCSPHQQVLTVRRRPNVAMGGGYEVTECTQKHVVFRVDGCGTLGSREKLVLKDGCGEALLLIRRKEGVVEALSLYRRWRGYRVQYEVPQELLFTLKDPKSCLAGSNAIRISAQHRICDSSGGFTIRGNFSDKDCSIVDGRGIIIAQIWRNQKAENWKLSDDLYHVTIKPKIDQAFVIGVIAVLDYIYGESTR